MLNMLAYVLSYTLTMNGSTIGTTTLNNIPTYEQCVQTGNLIKAEMAKSGVRVTYTCRKG